MDEITFDSLPQSVGQLLEDVREIKKMLKDSSKAQEPEPERWFNIEELCSYLPDRPVRATIYEKVQSRKIPFRKAGKRLIFLKSEIDVWLKQGKQKTASEISLDAEKYINGKKRAEL